MNNKRAHIIAAGGTVLSLLLLFLLLWFVYMKTPVVEEDEGIVISFGNAEVGGGQSELVTPPAESSAASVPQPQTPSDNPLLTQETESPVAVPDPALEEHRRQEAERLERERQEALARAEAQARAQEQARQQENINKSLADAFSNRFSDAEGKGDSDNANATQGSPKASDITGGIQASVRGRNHKDLPNPKLSAGTTEGYVVISIRVDAKGKVIAAKEKGGNISDKQVINECKAAALKSTFTPGNGEIEGSITYHIELSN